MRQRISRKLILSVFLCVFVAMLVFNFLTPIISDDYAHYFGTEGEHCITISEIIKDLANFRNVSNGRVLPHFFVYLFLTMPKAVFNIVNSLISTLLLMAMFRFYNREYDLTSLVLLLCNVFMLWYFIQSFGQVFLWLTGACNYSWALLIYLVLLFPFFCVLTGKKNFAVEEKHTAKKIMFLILAFAAGAWSENGSASVMFVVAAAGLLIWIRGKKFPLYMFFVFVSMFAGFLFLFTAPATIQTRAGGDIMEHIWYIRVLMREFCTILIILYVVLLAAAFALKKDKLVMLFTLIIVFAGCVSVAVFVFAVYLPPRSFYIILTFLILSVLLLMKELANTKFAAVNYVIAAVMAALFITRFVPGVEDIFYLHSQQIYRESAVQKAIESGKKSVVLPAYKANTMYPAAYEEELSDDPSFWYNDLVAKYHGLLIVEKQK